MIRWPGVVGWFRWVGVAMTVFVGRPAPAQIQNPPTKIKLGVSQTKLKRITELLQAEVNAKRISGAVAAVTRRGKIAYFESVGMARHNDRRANADQCDYFGSHR